MQNVNSPDEVPPTYLINSVDHALHLLLLLQERSELRVRDVAKELNVADSTAHRILSTLAWRGFVIQDRGSKTYRAGRVLVEIALAAIKELDVRRRAHSHMERLAGFLHETVNLIALEDDGCRFIDGVEGDRLMRVSARTGTLLPAYATSGGKVLLAELPTDKLHELYPKGLRKLTDKTSTDFGTLEVELARVRERGYALNIDESEVGLRAVAVAIRDRSGRAIAALAVTTPSSRMLPTHIPALVATLREFAADIRAALL